MKRTWAIYALLAFVALQIIPYIFAGCSEENPCQNGGTCSIVNGSVSCQCPEGFIGENCDVDDDECLGSPCLNGMNCVNTFGSYNCTCVYGWEGEDCKQEDQDDED